MKFDNVSVVCKANIFFDGKVVSHSVFFADGSKNSIGVMYPGSYKFDTGMKEIMEITSCSCKARIGDEAEWTEYPAGTAFTVQAGMSFEMSTDDGITEYVCSFE